MRNKRKTICLLVIVTMLLGALSGCTKAEQETFDKTLHHIGVLVYNTQDEEVQAFRAYLEGYIASAYEDVKFHYSESIRSAEDEMAALEGMKKIGVEGIMSFITYDLKKETDFCRDNQMYYVLASGTVADEIFTVCAENPYFLGIIGPGSEMEYQAGAEMAQWFAENEQEKNFLVFSGGAAFGNEMHRLRTQGILDVLGNTLGVQIPVDAIFATEPKTISGNGATIRLFPGYISREETREAAEEELLNGQYANVLSVLPVAASAEVITKTNVSLGVVDCYTETNLTLFQKGNLKFITGKFRSQIGPSFAAMYNAVSGHADDFRDGGNAFRMTQAFWTSDNLEDYTQKYNLTAAVVENAYSAFDLNKVLKAYSADADLPALKTLTESCSFEAARARIEAAK